MKYSSDDDGKIFQQKPIHSKPSQFRPKGWTDTVLGYINEAKQLTLCILSDRDLMGRPYAWAVHINISMDLTPDQHADLWATTCLRLRRKGVVALWVREPNKANRVHYHLIIKSDIGKRELERVVEEAMPPRKEVKWRKRVERIKNQWYYPHYITKAKVARTINGKRIEDFYAKKRLLFKTNLDFKKCGTIGDFWKPGKTKKTLWQEIKDREKRIGEGLKDWRIRRLAKHVYEMFGGDVPLKELERSFGYWSGEPAVWQWADRLMAEDTDGY